MYSPLGRWGVFEMSTLAGSEGGGGLLESSSSSSLASARISSVLLSRLFGLGAPVVASLAFLRALGGDWASLHLLESSRSD